MEHVVALLLVEEIVLGEAVESHSWPKMVLSLERGLELIELPP